MKRRTLTGHLLAWTLASLCVVWLGFVLIGFKTGEHEADELTDGHLASVATLLLDYGRGEFATGAGMSAPPEASHDLKAHDYQQSMSVVIWDGSGSMLTRRGEAPPPPFTGREGFNTVRLGDPPAEWRTFSRWNGDRTRLLMVLLSIQERDSLATDIAQQLAEPGLWLLPVVALALGLAIQRGMAPLYQLSREILALDIHRSQPLQVTARHQEFESAVQAINTLVDRYNAALKREQDLANEFAHELRTPLASLSLQARALRAATPAQVDEGLSRIEQDALRAGETVAHLLALARVSRTGLEQLQAQVDLLSLAQDVVAAIAPAAHQRGHELGVSGEPLLVPGHRGLLEIAVRNLVENAISHTAPGTYVEVRVDPADRTIQVCDNGPLRPAATCAEEAHLGLGHRVVVKVAHVHRARFSETRCPSGLGRCYCLAFRELPNGTTFSQSWQ